MGGRVGQGVPAAAGASGSKTGKARSRLLLEGMQGLGHGIKQVSGTLACVGIHEGCGTCAS